MTAKKLLVGSAVLLAAGSLSAVPMDLADLKDDAGDPVFGDVPSGKYFDTQANYVYLTDTDGHQDDSNVTLFAQTSSSESGNAFGIYDKDSGNELSVFDYGEEPIIGTTLAFDLESGMVTNHGSGETANIGKTFGFYIQTSAGDKIYSDPALNSSGDHAGIYNTYHTAMEGLYGSNVVTAFEDGDPEGGNFSDLVVGFTDVAAIRVPEPGTLALLGLGMLGLGFSRQCRKA